MSLYNCSACEGSGWSGYNETQCYRITTSAATAPVNPLNVLDTGFAGYSQDGSYFYQYLPPLTADTTEFFGVPTFTIVNGNDAWDNTDFSVTGGPLNRVAGWASLGSSAPPFDVWLGFSACLSGFTEEKTYWVGIGGDNYFRLKLDGETIIETPSGVLACFERWNVYPVVIGAGNHTLELFGLNTSGYAGFGCEIYDADLATLTGLTSYSQIKPYVKFTSSGQTLYNVVQTEDNVYTNSGYTCTGDYTYSICDNACVKYEFCDKPENNCELSYCISNTGYPSYNGIYNFTGDYNGMSYWTGSTSGLFMYYNTGSTRWCLSSTLGGTCLLSGK